VRYENTVRVHSADISPGLHPISFWDGEKVRHNFFLPKALLRDWGMEGGKEYRVTVEEVDLQPDV